MITDVARPPVRATQDVDLVAEVATHAAYYTLTEELKKAGFKEHVGDVTCRWHLGELMVDVMPTDEAILGFSNRWYPEAIKRAVPTKLPSGVQIKLISPPLLVATKLEAFYGRGNGDFATSRDIEDIINVVDGRPELAREIALAEAELRRYLRDEIDELLATEPFLDTLPYHIAPDNQGRLTIIIERLRDIAGL
jgi:hypothetical protein